MNNRISVGVLGAAAVGALALAACGGGGLDSSSKVDTSTPQAMAASLARGGFACDAFKDNPAAVGPKASGECRHGSVTVTLSTFASSIARDQLISAFGSSDTGTSAVGEAWLVTANTREEAQQVARALGGSVR